MKARGMIAGAAFSPFVCPAILFTQAHQTRAYAANVVEAAATILRTCSIKSLIIDLKPRGAYA